MLMTGSMVFGLAVFAIVAFATLNRVRINSAMYNDIALAYQLAGDVYDPPASLVAGLPAALAAEEASSPDETRKAVEQLQQDHKAFEDSHQHYSQVLPAGAIRDLLRDESYPAGRDWYAIAEKEYIPALLAGDHEAARKIRIEKMNPLFAKQKAANDKLSGLTADWIPSQEKNAGAMIRSRSITLGVLFFGMLIVLIMLGYVIANSIIVPVKKTVTVLSAMADGDLSQMLEINSKDEMRDVADALNRVIASFDEVLSAISVAARSLASASTELTATSQDTAHRLEGHSADTKKLASTMEQMSEAISDVSRSASSASQMGSQTELAADKGRIVVEELVDGIRRAAGVTTEAADQIENLTQNSEQIGKIVNVIEEIANQTNLLALNAAIEAARAGEQGRGFAVVAGEVRRLAERTSAATQEIAAMIQTIQNETAQAMQSMERGKSEVDASLAKTEECGAALHEIVQSARDSEKMAMQIAAAANEQSLMANQVTGSMTSISEFTMHATAAGQQTVAACGSLEQLAADLEQHVQRFKVREIGQRMEHNAVSYQAKERGVKKPLRAPLLRTS